jgi:hypothetical protein
MSIQAIDREWFDGLDTGQQGSVRSNGQGTAVVNIPWYNRGREGHTRAPSIRGIIAIILIISNEGRDVIHIDEPSTTHHTPWCILPTRQHSFAAFGERRFAQNSRVYWSA